MRMRLVNFLNDFKACQAGQHEVEHNRFEGLAADCIKRRIAFSDALGLQTGVMDEDLEELQQRRIVFDQKDRHWTSSTIRRVKADAEGTRTKKSGWSEDQPDRSV